MFFRFQFTITLLYCPRPLFTASISLLFDASWLLATGFKPPNYLASLPISALAFFIALTSISLVLYSVTVCAAMVNPSPSGCAMSLPICLPCLPNSVMGCTQSVGCFSLPTVTTPSRSSTLCNATSTTIIHPINSHALFFLKLNCIYDNNSFMVLSTFYENALVKSIGLSLPLPLLWRPSMPLLSKLFTRSSPCRCGCGKFSSLFPHGFHSGSVHHSHFFFSLTWTLLASPSLISAFPHFFKQRHPPLPSFTSSPVWYTRNGVETSSLDSLPPPLTCWLSHPCVFCGGGDNSVQHWLNFCPIPALAGSLLLNRPWRTRYWYFMRSHSLGHRSILASLWVATRQFVHERSGLPPPSLVPPSVSSANTLAFPRLLAERAYQLLPQFFRSHTAFIPSSPSFSPSPHSCTFELIHFPMLTLEAEGHPLFYGPAPATSTALGSDDLIGIFSPSSPLIKKLFAFQRSVARPPNCTLQFKLCSCGAIHGYLQALVPLPPNSPLFIGGGSRC